MKDEEIKVMYRIEKVSEREKAILFDYDGMEEDNKITEIMEKNGY
jgi:hypothetical protein